MAAIRPFAGIRYAKTADLDISNVIAPPYDVLNEKDKLALQAKHPKNIVSVDLPFLPPKSVGPDAVYQQADATLRQWLLEGALHRDPRAALYPYAQSFQHLGRTYHRRGFIALVRLSPFGAGDVVPHEKTYAGPIEDRLKLMHATGVQLSPIFGLFSDPDNKITQLAYQHAGKPMLTGTLDGVRNDLWSEPAGEIENQIIDLMRSRPVYIADGHHRYTTALQYQRDMQQANGGPLPEAHPANWCMFVLVSMQDEGLLILPTHRLVGGLREFTPDAFRQALGSCFDLVESPLTPDQLAHQLHREPAHTFGLYDGATRKSYLLHLRNLDILTALEPNQSPAWRGLDVAILQRYVMDEVLRPKYTAGTELAKGYTADAGTIAGDVDGGRYQIALLLKPTPLRALEDLGRHGEVMPQKSTYFYPKLATGMVMYPLR